MCVNGELVSALKVMSARWDYQGRRSMSVMKMVDGVISMGMMLVVEVVIPCHSFVHVSVPFFFLDFFRFL